MSAKQRPYRFPEDLEAVGRLLVRSYRTEGPHRNWLQPRWEHMHFHSLLDERELELGRCAVWEESGEIVGAVQFGHRMGIVYPQVDPCHDGLKAKMLEHTAEHLGGEFVGGGGARLRRR